MKMKWIMRVVVHVLVGLVVSEGAFAQVGKAWDKRFGGASHDYGTVLMPEFLTVSGIDAMWDATIGGSAQDELRAMGKTSDGGYILGGFSSSPVSGEKSETCRGGQDYWIAKVSATGVPQWNKTFGGSGHEWLDAVSQTADGGYILGGHSASGVTGDKTSASRGGYDYWIVKTDANGVKEWDRTFGGSSGDYLFATFQTPDGGYFLAGYSQSGISGDRTQASRGGVDYWVLKLDANGNKLWDKAFGGSSQDELYSALQTADGGYILAGRSSSGVSGEKTQPSQGGFDYWIVKIDANGSKQWDRTYGAPGTDLLSAIQQVEDGGFLLIGGTWSGVGGNKSEPSRGGSDYWIVKVDSSGALEWEKTLGGSADDYANAGLAIGGGGYVVAGYSASGVSGDKTSTCRGDKDYWCIKLTGEGYIVWDRTMGGSGADWLYGIQSPVASHYLLGGWSSSGVSGEKTEASRGLGDFWIVELDEWSIRVPDGCVVGGHSSSGGTTGQDGDRTENCRGGLDYWIMRLNDSGEKKFWPAQGYADARFGGSGSDYLNAIMPTPDGGYLLGGHSNSGNNGDKSEPSRGGYDYWVVKVSSSGQKEWDKTFGGSVNDYLFALSPAYDVDGTFDGYLLAGYSYSTTSGDKTAPIKSSYSQYGNCDYWIVRIDLLGNKLWDKDFGGGNSAKDELYDAKPTVDGGWILAGRSPSSAGNDKSASSINGTFDYWVIKIDRSGNAQWDKTVGGSGSDILSAVSQTDDYGYVLVGGSSSGISGDRTQPNFGGNDFWVVKLDSVGQKVWDKALGGSGDDYAFWVEECDGDNIVVVGRSNSGINLNGGKTEACKGSYDFWAVQMNSAGVVQWDKTLGGGASDEGWRVASLGEYGRFILSGTSASGISGDKTQSSRGGNDFWVVQTGVNPPDIAVECPADEPLVDGTSVVDFGSVVPAQSSMKTFVIKNDGGKELNSLTITKDGANASEFSVGALSATYVAPGCSVTFTVTFTPTTIGLRSASLHIASNDPDESPFDIGLSGTGQY